MRQFDLRSKGFVRLSCAPLRLAVPLAALWLSSVAHAQTLTPDAAAKRDAAIVAARDGDYRNALIALDALRAEDPDNIALLHDQITVLAWSENNLAAVQLALGIDAASAPRYTQLAVAKAARNIQRFDVAAAWYDAALANDATDLDALTGRLLTAGDARDASTVRQLVDATAERAAHERSLELARAYALRSIGESLPALIAYDRVLDQEPSNSEALRGKALVLRSMLLPTQALELAAAHPGILNEAEIERLETDEAAITLRLTSRTPYPAPATNSGIDRSLALIDSSLARSTTTTGRDTLLLDRVVALSDANEAEAAIEAFETLPESTNRDQSYVLLAAARAYLQAHKPHTALRLLERARELDPANLEVRFALVYTWLDLDRYDRAFTLTGELTNSLPMANRAAGSNVIKGNDAWMRAELLAGITEAYGDQLEAAQARFETLLAAAPGNADLRQELANVYRWRGWLERSLDEYRQVVTTNDQNLSAKLGLAHARIDARDFAAAEMAVAETQALDPREPSVQRLADRWQLHNRRELTVTASSGESTGPVAGTDNYAIDARWYSAPIAYRYRAFVGTHDGYASFPEGDARRRRLGAGVEYRAPRFTLTGLVTGARDGAHSGLAGQMDYRLSDFWSVGGGIELESDAVQLRAYRQDIDADRAFASARYAPSELASVSLSLSQMDYSDGNSMQILSADGRYRIFNRPRSKLEAIGTIGLGRADSSAVPYFSPTHDTTAEAGIEHQYRLFRRYERELNQTVGVTTGRYWQAGFDPGSTWSVRYRIEGSLSERLVLGIEAMRSGQIYDGEREHSTTAIVTVAARF